MFFNSKIEIIITSFVDDLLFQAPTRELITELKA